MPALRQSARASLHTDGCNGARIEMKGGWPLERRLAQPRSSFVFGSTLHYQPRKGEGSLLHSRGVRLRQLLGQLPQPIPTCNARTIPSSAMMPFFTEFKLTRRGSVRNVSTAGGPEVARWRGWPIHSVEAVHFTVSKSKLSWSGVSNRSH